MVLSSFALKAAALFLLTVSLGAVANASDAMTPQKEALKNVDLASFGIDDRGNGRELGWGDGFTWNWNVLLFDLHVCPCQPGNGGPLHFCHDMCHLPGPPGPHHVRESCGCCEKIMYEENCGVDSDGSYDGCYWDGDSQACVSTSADVTADGSSSSSGSSASGENRSVGGASVKSNWWMYVVGAAAVAGIAGAIIMRKRRNAAAQEGLDGETSLSGAVNKRASLLAGGSAGAAAMAPGAAAVPAFLSVPSFRRSPSGLEVDASGAIVEQSPSSYMEMDNHVDPSQLPDGVEVSHDGNLEPYHSGSMA